MEAKAFKILGIDKPSGDVSDIELTYIIQKGFTKENYLHAKRASGFSHEAMASILSLSTKTIEKYSNKQRLDDKSSERLLKLAEVIALGNETFGSHELFTEWLKRPLRPLEGKKPIDLMINIHGLEVVKALIGRIEHSVYS